MARAELHGWFTACRRKNVRSDCVFDAPFLHLRPYADAISYQLGFKLCNFNNGFMKNTLARQCAVNICLKRNVHR